MMISDANQWAQIELRHLIALQAVAETGSFGRGAVQIGYTQSALSQQIAALEQIIGERLVERSRGPRPVTLTEAGKMLVKHAESIVAHLRAAYADMQAFRAGEAGVLRVGTYQSVGARLLPTVLKSFARAFPNVELVLQEDAREERLLQPITTGELDLAFTILPLLEGPFAAVEILTDPWIAIVSRESPCATECGPLALAALNEQPHIGFQHCRTSEFIEGYLAERQIARHTVFRSDDNGAVRGMVAAGLGVALMPLLTYEPDPRVVAHPLADTIPPRRIGLAWREGRYLSPAAQAFIAMAQECGQALQADLMAALRDISGEALLAPHA